MDWLFTLLTQIQPWHWLAFGLVLLGAELLSGTTYLLWPAVAAWLTGLVMLFVPIAWPGQLAVFATVTVVTSLTGRHYIKGRFLKIGAGETLNDAHAQLMGQVGAVEQPILQGVGQVRLGDTVWRATADEALQPGDAIEVIGVDGATVHVRKRKALPGG